MEAARVKGKPAQRHVAYLGGIADASDTAQRHRFWASVLAVLARLSNRVTPAQREAIIAALATRVPGPPTKAERARLAKQQTQALADYYGQGKTFAAIVKVPSREMWEKKIVMRRPDGSAITVDDVHWQIAKLAYEIATGKVGDLNLSQRTRLTAFARAIDMPLWLVQAHAKTWRVWTVEHGDKRR